jgi:hypothetical protein
LATVEVNASEARLTELRGTDPGALVIVRFLDEQDPGDQGLLRMSLAFTDAIVASDAMPVVFEAEYEAVEWPLPPGRQTHPRTTGTFAKAIRTMVSSGVWTWAEAFRRCSWYWIARRCPTGPATPTPPGRRPACGPSGARHAGDPRRRARPGRDARTRCPDARSAVRRR